jgi:hypothetical protein
MRKSPSQVLWAFGFAGLGVFCGREAATGVTSLTSPSSRKNSHPADDAKLVLHDLLRKIVERDWLEPKLLDQSHHLRGGIVSRDPLLERLGPDLV